VQETTTTQPSWAVEQGRRIAAFWRAHRALRLVAMVAVALAINVMTWPSLWVSPQDGLDGSWQIALHLAADQGMAFGSDIGFTYGPLGFLVFPLLVTGPTYALAFIATFAMRSLLILGLVVGGRRAFGTGLIAVPIAYVGAALFFTFPSEIGGLLALVVALLFIQQPCRTRRWVLISSGLMGVATGMLLLIKLDGGIIAIAVLGVTAWVQGRGRAVAVWAGSGVVTTSVLWLATGNSPADIPRWIAWSAEIVSGYSGATMLEQPGRAWEYAVFLPLAVGLLALSAYAWRTRPLVQRLALSAVLALGVWATFKHGFVRHDSHAPFAIASIGVLPAVVAWREPALRVAGVVLAIVGLFFAIQSASEPTAHLLDPRGRPQSAWIQAEMMADASARADEYAVDRQRLRDRLKVPPAILRRIGKDGVHITPFEVAVAWTYGLNWHPLPQFQSFSTWTTALDHVNGDVLRGASAPEYVLRANVKRTDSQSPIWQSPDENLALLCRYVPVVSTARWQLLQRSVNRCGAPVLIGMAEARAGRAVVVPRAGRDHIVFARLHWSPDLGERTLSVLFKPSRIPEIRLAGAWGKGRYRIPAALLDAPLVLRAPVPKGMPARPANLLRTERLTLIYPPQAGVDFYEVPIRPR
jgi:hypothetical protein